MQSTGATGKSIKILNLKALHAQIQCRGGHCLLQDHISAYTHLESNFKSESPRLLMLVECYATISPFRTMSICNHDMDTSITDLFA